jgi:hypothetical protein
VRRNTHASIAKQTSSSTKIGSGTNGHTAVNAATMPSRMLMPSSRFEPENTAAEIETTGASEHELFHSFTQQTGEGNGQSEAAIDTSQAANNTSANKV